MCRTVARSSASCPWYFSSSCGTESSLDGLCSLYSCRISRAMPSTLALPATSPAGSAARAQPSASSRRTTPSRAILGGTPINGVVFCCALHARGAPAHRLEASIGAVARQLGIDTQVLATPTSILIAFQGEPDARVALLREAPGLA